MTTPRVITVQEQIESTHEAFDLSVLMQTARMAREQTIQGPQHLQFVMGSKNAMPADREVFEFCVHTPKRLSPQATWTGAGIGRQQMTLARWSPELGGHCRTGLEDNVRLDRDSLAPSNAALAKAVRTMCEAHERPVATAAQARPC
jgi:3-keto-5-aminohexanoate cleavage enzyme